MMELQKIKISSLKISILSFLVKNPELPYKRSHINKMNKGGLHDFIKKYDIDLTDIKPLHVVEYAVVKDPPVVVEPAVVEPVVEPLAVDTVTICKPTKPRKARCPLKISEKLDKDPTIIKKRKSSVVCFDLKKNI